MTKPSCGFQPTETSESPPSDTARRQPSSEAHPLEGYVHFGWLPVDHVLVG